MGLTLVSYSMINGAPVNVLDYGVDPTGVVDSTTQLQDIFDAVETAGGGTIYFPDGTYKTTLSLFVGSNLRIEFSGNAWIKSYGTDGYSAMLTNKPTGAANVTIINPQLDGNNTPSICGIIVRRNATEWRIIGGLIKNCKHDPAPGGLGGRCINIEAGDTPPASCNCTITGTVLQDSYEGLSLSGGPDQEQTNNVITNLVIERCESAITFFGNAGGYPHIPNEMSYVLSNISIRNCGVATTYARVKGIINSDRGSNIAMSNIFAFNDASYGYPEALFNGTFYNFQVSNVLYDGDLSLSLFCFYNYNESSPSYNGYDTVDNNFANIKCNGTAPDIIVMPSNTVALSNCQFDVSMYDISSNRLVSGYLYNKTTSKMKAYVRQYNLTVEGFFNEFQYRTQVSDYTPYGNYSLGNYSSGQLVQVANNSVVTISPPNYGGFAYITSYDGSARNYPQSEFSNWIFYDCGGTLLIEKGANLATLGTLFNVTTSNVTGTTGTNGYVTVAVQTGVLKIENRSGGTLNINVAFVTN